MDESFVGERSGVTSLVGAAWLSGTVFVALLVL